MKCCESLCCAILHCRTCALNKITHLRLDRENIGRIDSLELLGKKVTNVYLQHVRADEAADVDIQSRAIWITFSKEINELLLQNRIPRLENLDCLPNLTFLMLAENQINRIEGLSHLHKLAFLDLSQNQIKSFDIGKPEQYVSTAKRSFKKSVAHVCISQSRTANNKFRIKRYCTDTISPPQKTNLQRTSENRSVMKSVNSGK